jgi:ferredoxin
MKTEPTMYVILTSKPGVFRTELGEGLTAVDVYDYILFGRKKAQFIIARIEGSPRITIIEDEPPHVVNHIPSKFLQKYESAAAAYEDLQQLSNAASDDVRLEPVAAAPAAPVASGLLSVTFVTNGGKVAIAPVNSNLLRVSLREQGGIPFKCGGGLCGTCKCRIEQGLEHTDAVKAKERKHLSEDEFANGYRMACQTFLKGDVSVSWKPKAASASPPLAAAQPADPA